MNIATYSKEPSAVLTFENDLTIWLNGRTITASTWTVPAGITKDDDDIATPAVKTTITLSGGTWAASYPVTNHITASDGDEQDFTFTVKMQYDVRYASINDVRANAQGMTASAVPAADNDLVFDLIERASRMFDREVGVPDGYFNPPLYPHATARVFYGDGTNILKLDPYVPESLSALTVPEGYTAPDYIAQNGHLLRSSETGIPNPIGRYDNYGWMARVPVTVTAQWGYESTPSDVQSAVIELAINLWREVDPATAKLSGMDGSIRREAIPPRVKEIVKFYRVKCVRSPLV